MVDKLIADLTEIDTHALDIQDADFSWLDALGDSHISPLGPNKLLIRRIISKFV